MFLQFTAFRFSFLTLEHIFLVEESTYNLLIFFIFGTVSDHKCHLKVQLLFQVTFKKML